MSTMTTPVVKHFLLVFDHEQARLIDQDDFDHDLDAAVAAYGEMEKRYRENENIDIVLVGSDSIETVMVTHANYFDGSAGLSKYLTPSKYLQGI